MCTVTRSDSEVDAADLTTVYHVTQSSPSQYSSSNAQESAGCNTWCKKISEQLVEISLAFCRVFLHIMNAELANPHTALEYSYQWLRMLSPQVHRMHVDAGGEFGVVSVQAIGSKQFG